MRSREGLLADEIDKWRAAKGALLSDWFGG